MVYEKRFPFLPRALALGLNAKSKGFSNNMKNVGAPIVLLTLPLLQMLIFPITILEIK